MHLSDKICILGSTVEEQKYSTDAPDQIKPSENTRAPDSNQSAVE